MSRSADKAGRPADATRARLLASSIEAFGRHGYDGASTRRLAEAAGANLQAIPYYFGGKEGLYRAAADYVAEVVAAQVAVPLANARSLLSRPEPPTAAETRTALVDLLSTLAAFFADPAAEAPSRFILREQLDPSEAFQALFNGMMAPIFETLTRLSGLLLDEDPGSRHVRMRALSLLGGVMVYRVAHAAVARVLDRVDPGDLRLLVEELVAPLATGQ